MLVTWLLESPLFMLSGRPDWRSRRHAWRWIGKSESSPVMVSIVTSDSIAVKCKVYSCGSPGLTVAEFRARSALIRC